MAASGEERAVDEERTARRVSEELLTLQEVADRLGVNVQSVRNWIARGELSAIKLGGPAGYRIMPEDLDAFLMRRRLVAGFQRELEGRDVGEGQERSGA